MFKSHCKYKRLPLNSKIYYGYVFLVKNCMHMENDIKLTNRAKV